jgi:hypothetical protein
MDLAYRAHVLKLKEAITARIAERGIHPRGTK